MKLKSSIILLSLFLIGTALVTFVNAENSNNNKSIVLQIRNNKTSELLETLPIKHGSIVRLKFLHSYDRGYVWEDFIIDNKKFLLKELAYAVPSYDMRDKTYPKASRRLGKDGVVYVENINEFYQEEFSKFLIRVPYTVPHWVITKDEKIELSTLASSGTLLKIDIKEIEDES